jgi:hypothetical protein
VHSRQVRPRTDTNLSRPWTRRVIAKLWREQREHCRVRRFWNGNNEQIGWLVHKPGGPEHARWVFDYDASRNDDDEAGYRFGGHAFVPGEYVSIAHDNDLYTFKVVSIEPAT